MTTFIDRKGKQWDVTLTLAGAKRIDNSDFSTLGVEKFTILQPPDWFYPKLFTDTAFCMAIIWAIVKPQADVANITEEVFCDNLDGQAISKAKEGLWGALSDFFPERKTALSKVVESYKQAEKKLQEGLAAMNLLTESRLNQEIERELLQMEKKLNKISGE